MCPRRLSASRVLVTGAALLLLLVSLTEANPAHYDLEASRSLAEDYTDVIVDDENVLRADTDAVSYCMVNVQSRSQIFTCP